MEAARLTQDLQTRLEERANRKTKACWNVCDWFCVKVLGSLVEMEGEACARAIAGWRRAENLWQRRAAGVAFVNLVGRGDKNFGVDL